MRLLLNKGLFVSLFFTMSCSLFAKDVSQGGKDGAQLFSERCVLCHGSQGMGEGPLAMSLKDYPSTNLLHSILLQTRQNVMDIIRNGSGATYLMPPWKNELNDLEIEEVTDFVMLLRSEPASALGQLSALESHKQKSISDGQKIYRIRCVLCHGNEGLGDGRMKKVVKNPPPFNLTLSQMPRAYLKEIITKGGEPLARSYQMPPWGDQLTSKEIDAVVDYIMTLRK